MLDASPQFRDIFHRSPTVLARAPGRINLIGEHVDYQGGLVLPTAINRYIYAAAAPITQNEIRLWTPLQDAPPLTLSLENPTPLTGANHWANYILGVVATYRDAGHPICGFEAAFDSDLPIGAGLSSSAALESATALIVETLTNTPLAAIDRAVLCQKAEHEFAGVPCGIMDQFAVNAGIEGHALLLDCRSLEWKQVAIPDGVAFVIINSGVKHALADGEYAKRRADCEAAAEILGTPSLRDATPASVDSSESELGEKLHRRARHVTTEIARATDFAAALAGGKSDTAGQLMSASHASLRDDFEVSCPEIDRIIECARAEGAIGARIMGGGFGGSVIALVKSKHAEQFTRNMVANHPAKIEAFPVRLVDGASASVPD